MRSFEIAMLQSRGRNECIGELQMKHANTRES
jgi:hypothetical protein